MFLYCGATGKQQQCPTTLQKKLKGMCRKNPDWIWKKILKHQPVNLKRHLSAPQKEGKILLHNNCTMMLEIFMW